MNKEFPYLDVPASLKPIVGVADPETRIYRREGSDEESGPWFDALCEHFPGEGFISPGGVGMYAPVSRAAFLEGCTVMLLSVSIVNVFIVFLLVADELAIGIQHAREVLLHEIPI